MRPANPFVSVSLVTLGMVATQIGASLAKGLFLLIGASGTTALRLLLSALVLAILFRPWRFRLDRAQWRAVGFYGAAMGAMNLLFYSALATIPLGVAVALEFTGPLAVALAGSRRGIDFGWVALAVLGLLFLLPLFGLSEPLDPMGVVLALAAGAFWAGYIVFGQRAGTGGGPHTVALGVGLGAALVLPFGLWSAGAAMFDPAILPLALAMALLSSAIPYSLDMLALPHLPARTFGILMSAQPALAALMGLVLLGEQLSAWQWAGIGAVMLASLGSTATAHRNPPPLA
ncbi:EamA family transporter [Devosia sp. 1566]|uniref:EamA family transporter n=1 Tax=Devosia sp. 1566 TaxID=2499144 RepID=UPI0020BE3D3B|nr:EamA family transporter [Devosia sp. 1566]